ncbi:MAG: diphthine synthase [Candidatus Methylarchaceae archaeon HK01B]|nr:diphthine synthase [Candidatus Methylarchaceae archaeon HK01B]
MLSFIGLGLYGMNGISVMGLDLAKKADVVYLDVYTSPIPEGDISSLQGLIDKKIIAVGRDFIEDGYDIINQAKEKEVALMIPGDPMVATTHMDLRLRAEKAGIKTYIVHASSILSALPGETGLHIYSFGKPVTLMRSGWAPISTVYEVVYENLTKGLHTAVLLEYDHSTDFFLKPGDALQSLLEMEEDFEQGIFHHETFVLVASRVGSHFQSLSGGKLVNLIHQDYGDPPHILLVPGKLHFTEVDALKTLLKIDEDQITDNSSRAQRLAVAMVTRYVRASKKALSKARERGKAEGKRHLDDLFENVECYILDAERFLNMGKHELAILSTGYAEGLLDSLRFIGELEVEW